MRCLNETIFFTGFDELINVWSNDANKLVVFITLTCLPFLFLIFYFIFKESIKGNIFLSYLRKLPEKVSTENTLTAPLKKSEVLKSLTKEKINKSGLLNRIIVEFVFLIIVFLNAITLIGVGQLVLPDLFDALVRGIGTVLFVSGIFLCLVYFMIKNEVKNKNIFYTFIRYPEYFFMVMISSGISIMSLNAACIILIFFILIPLIVIKVFREEKKIVKLNDTYENYKDEVSMIFPDIIKILKRIYIEKNKGKKNE